MKSGISYKYLIFKNKKNLLSELNLIFIIFRLRRADLIFF